MNYSHILQQFSHMPSIPIQFGGDWPYASKEELAHVNGQFYFSSISGVAAIYVDPTLEMDQAVETLLHEYAHWLDYIAGEKKCFASEYTSHFSNILSSISDYFYAHYPAYLAAYYTSSHREMVAQLFADICLEKNVPSEIEWAVQVYFYAITEVDIKQISIKCH